MWSLAAAGGARAGLECLGGGGGDSERVLFGGGGFARGGHKGAMSRVAAALFAAREAAALSNISVMLSFSVGGALTLGTTYGLPGAVAASHADIWLILRLVTFGACGGLGGAWVGHVPYLAAWAAVYLAGIMGGDRE